MVRTENTTSIRVVSVDHYMHKPEPQFDTCYSEFKGCEVKQVPVLRLFGSTSEGTHSCVHIHGVFPYLYVPYDGSTDDSLAVDRLMYQLAGSLDKAINVSLGNANSTASHVFRISLVKGLPIYGFHRKEHHFLKIYLYNPFFIRKATNLLMNGVILSRVFQTFETHIPYILQFFIDYNLYGMSFLHVPNCAIRERTGADSGLQKMSTSEYEIDILATDILNRSSMEEEKRSEYANPGIASIWNDEKARRNILEMDQPEALGFTQSGKVEIVTESDRFYRDLLASKLVSENNMEVTGSDNARKIKPPVSFYPSEVDDQEQLLDASCVQDHKTFSLRGYANLSDVLSSQIDEDRIISMSQYTDTTFAEEDHELLDIMKELEGNENNDVENDSLLAPLTQQGQGRIVTAGGGLGLSQSSDRKLNATLSGDLETVVLMQAEEEDIALKEQQILDFTLESDDEFLLDYTAKMNVLEAGANQVQTPGSSLLDDNEDDILIASTIPQLDGAHNEVPFIPTKRSRTNGVLSTSMNGFQANGHEPLPKRIRCSRELKILTGCESTKRSVSNGLFTGSMSPINRKKIRTEQNNSCMQNGFVETKPDMPKLKELKIRVSKMDLSSYRLPPKESPVKKKDRDLSPYDEFRLAREYDLANNWDPHEGLSCGRKRRGRGRPKAAKTTKRKPKRRSPAALEPEPEIDIVLSQKFQNIIKLSPSVLLKPLTSQQMADLREESTTVPEPMLTSNCSDVIIISDEESRSSGCHKVFELPEIPMMETIREGLPISDQEGMPEPKSPDNVDSADDDDLNIKSFYDRTLVFDDFDEIGSASDESIINQDFTTAVGSDRKVAITLQEQPPSFEDALKALQEFVIPKVVNQEPFYGNPADVTGKKEVGHVVLNIGGKSLKDLEEFRSVVSGLGSINQARYEKLRSIYGESLDQILGESSARPCSSRLKELVASDRPVTIHLAAKPPSKHEAKVWLKAVEAIRTAEASTVEQDSPIKVKKMGAIMAASSSQEVQNQLQKKIDHESTLNLSSLIADSSQIDCSARKSLVSRIFSMNAIASPATSNGGSPSVGADRMELLNYSARRKRRKTSKAKLSLSVAFKRLRSAKAAEESFAVEESPEEIAPGQGGTSFTANSFVEEGLDVVNSSQILSPSQKSESSDCTASDQTTLPHSAEVASMKQRLLTESPLTSESSHQANTNGNISTTTQHNNTFGFKVNFENLQKAKATCEYNHLTIISVEIHVQTRADLRPNPEIDPISAIFYRIHNDVPEDHRRAPSVCGIILNHAHSGTVPSDRSGLFKYNQCAYTADVVTVANERELYEKFLMLISFWDPDIFAGYEIEQMSWGYIIQRGYVLEMNLMKMLSRVPTAEKVHVSEEEEQDLLEMHDYSSGLQIPGRILLDIWRLMRHEIALTSYSFENIMYHIMHRRVPRHSYKQLTRLWNKPYSKWIVYEYYLERINGNLELLQQLDLIGRTAELAKLFGIQFYEVLSRGSQFRVESMMMRIAKPRNFVSLSPSIQQRAHMRAPEYLPLILEPNSRFYADPLIVLDFQSLYPSMIIAYNYCFSTCLGRVEHLGQSEPFEFGASQLRLPRKILQTLIEKNLITISPCGVAYVKSSVREGILPRMLNEILATRLMVKASMKLHKDNSILQRVLHSRQLGLKLIANVTYGYTAANFSGRMPCVEVGDSVVSKGRETLERAIKMVESSQKWGVKVVYGDTDSMFVLCPGRTKEEAFKIGEEIADAVSKDNPPPVKLKLEKVYQPAILQTKKRYVGYMYESADQEKPVYEAKGIETVRRDGCPVVGKMLEKVLRILFETRDVSKVKEYTCRQFTKILEGRVNLQDFIFAKEFRGKEGYKPGACVPALELSRRWKLDDPRREPRRGERVPYVIISGPPLVPLIRLVRSPDELLADSGLKINANYYISKAIIPPLNRCLLLIGADVNQWYNDLPRKFLMLHNTAGKGSSLASELQVPKKSTISQYFSTTSCVADCGNQTHRGICNGCLRKPQHTVSYVVDKINRLERRVELSEKMCKSCCQRTFETACNSLDCPVLFVLNRQNREHAQVQYYRDLLEEMF
ncbi:DNA polymerase zeta catalytic subunit [Topomyia yanbarensis]|uniref:DNA polymerase zeta catalytic subunit n=1 Tax=Topomyia yanbarensis TaxID=2498891 RepID=UPI00273C7857|nr:DNA polymerase zeta catalytic subunit [Topomyia yanbarensis]